MFNAGAQRHRVGAGEYGWADSREIKYDSS